MPRLAAAREADGTATVVSSIHLRPVQVKHTARTDAFLVVRTIPRQTVVGGRHVLVTEDLRVVAGARTRAEAQALARQHKGAVVVEVK